MTNEEVVRSYAAAQMAFDFEMLNSLRHPDWTAIWPQSGELLRGSTNEQAMMDHYPGGPPRVVKTERMVGSEDHWATTPFGGAYRVEGEGENWWGEWQMQYPDGRIYLTVILLELRDGKVFRETVYWAERFDAPAWRAPFVERMLAGR